MVISHRTLHALFWQQLYWLKKLLPETGGHNDPAKRPREAGSDAARMHFPCTLGLAKKCFVAPEGQAHTV